MPRGKRKNNRPTSTSLWTEFQRVVPFREDNTEVELEEGEQYWRNSFYTVMVKQLDPSIGMEGAVRLDIRHNDNKAIREWKHLQRIKNELVGEEREAVEIFPPQSMLLDMSNRHHLFVTPVGVTSVYIYEEKLKASGQSAYDAIMSERQEEEEVSEGQ